MARPLDPYRTLEVQRDATLDEVKAAYRRMAKRYHPDSGGAGALPRFLAIQAAYESLTEGPARLRLGVARPRTTTRNRRSGDTDHDRSRTTRDAGTRQDGRPAGASAGPSRRAGGAGGTSTGAGTSSGGTSTGHTSTGAGTSSGGPSRPGATGATGGRARRARRSPTSTSYDGMEGEPFEPEWEGASWYGGSSGTYWTLNPKEFADPRKHGPEYLARGRRDRSRPLAHRRPRGDPGDGQDRPGPGQATSPVDGDEAASDNLREAAAAETAAAAGEPARTATATEAARTASASGWTASASGWTDARAAFSAPASAAVSGIDSASDPGTLSEAAETSTRSAGSGRLAAIAIAVIAGVATMLAVLSNTSTMGTLAGSAPAFVAVAALVATAIVVGLELRGPGRRRT